MPTYEYECEKCSKSFEVEQKMSDPPLETCIRPRCRGKVKRLIASSTIFILKGTRWFRDGY